MYKNSKLYSVLSYITWIGWFIAFFARDKRDTLVAQHLNQGLILNLISIGCNLIAKNSGSTMINSAIAVIDIGLLVLSIMGIVRAVRLSEEPLPLIGSFRLIN